MHYLDAFRVPFQSPKWVQNILLMAVCILIPVVGQIVLMGYMFVVIEALHEGRKRPYPDLDFGRFVPYLTRGAWPFLVNLVVTLPFALVFMILYLVALFAVMGTSANSQGPNPLAMMSVVFGFVMVAMIFSCLIGLVLAPMMLRAGLAQDFKAGFSVEFVKDFLGRVWKETILAQLFLLATGLCLILVGYALCCVGLYPAAALLTFAQYHLWYQLYELYLQRGGTPIPLKPNAEAP